MNRCVPNHYPRFCNQQDVKISRSRFVRKTRKVPAIVGQEGRIRMQQDERHALARFADTSIEAASFRLRAARMALGVDQKTMAAALDMPSSSYASYETAKAYPSIEVMRHFRREHDISFDFVIYGDFRRLPVETAERVFAAMRDIEARKGRAEGPA
jgi:DNA-binding XRE family transcriptional regulator